MLKLWGEVRGVMGRGGDKCGVAVLGIWGSRKWVAGERGAPSEIRSVHSCAAPEGVRGAVRDSRCPWMHDTQSAQRDSQQLKYALWWLLV